MAGGCGDRSAILGKGGKAMRTLGRVLWTLVCVVGLWVLFVAGLSVAALAVIWFLAKSISTSGPGISVPPF